MNILWKISENGFAYLIRLGGRSLVIEPDKIKSLADDWVFVDSKNVYDLDFSPAASGEVKVALRPLDKHPLAPNNLIFNINNIEFMEELKVESPIHRIFLNAKSRIQVVNKFSEGIKFDGEDSN